MTHSMALNVATAIMAAGLSLGILSIAHKIELSTMPESDHMFMCIERPDGILSCRRVEVKP